MVFTFHHGPAFFPSVRVRIHRRSPLAFVEAATAPTPSKRLLNLVFSRMDFLGAFRPLQLVVRGMTERKGKEYMAMKKTLTIRLASAMFVTFCGWWIVRMNRLPGRVS